MEAMAPRTPVAELHDANLTALQQSVQIMQRFDQPASAALIQKHGDTIDHAHRRGLPLRFFGYHPTFSGHRVITPSASETDWVLMNVMNDPSFREITSSLSFNRRKPGTLYAPDEVIASLQATLEAGIDFDSVFIAHEVPGGSVAPDREIDLKTLLPPPPAEIRRKHAFRQRSLIRFWKEVLTLSKRMAQGVAIGTVAAIAAPAAIASAGAGLDPVLFGVNRDETVLVDGQPIAMWYYITHWRW